MMKSTAKCPQYAVIAAATDGNEMAIHKVLNHYDAYISKASLRPLFDEYLSCCGYGIKRQNPNCFNEDDNEI